MTDCATEQHSCSETISSLHTPPLSKSRRSSISTLYSTHSARRSRHYGLFNKLSLGMQRVFRRFSRAHRTLSDTEIDILTTITNFDREEILQWHSKFLADCPHGYMSRKQFISMYQSLCPNADVERFAGHIFRAFDLTKSNTVDFREFLVGLSITSTKSSVQTKLEWMFQVFDIDGNGLLTPNECLEVIDVIVRFKCSQQPPDDAISVDELVESAKRRMMRIFDDIPTGRRRMLTMALFVEGCEKDELISMLLAPTDGNDLVQ